MKLEHVQSFGEFCNENANENSILNIATEISKAIDIHGVSKIKFEKRSDGYAIVKWSGMMSNTAMSVYQNGKIKLNKNALEPGFIFQFQNDNQMIDFGKWYIKNEEILMSKATSGDNSGLANNFAREVQKKYDEIVK